MVEGAHIRNMPSWAATRTKARQSSEIKGVAPYGGKECEKDSRRSVEFPLLF